MLPKFLMSFCFLSIISCKQKIEGVIVDESSKMPIDSVAIAEHSFSNSYPYPFKQSNKYGIFSFTKENRNSILYFYKAGYDELRVDFGRNSILGKSNNKIYLIKKK
jgi:hypothetical protein